VPTQKSENNQLNKSFLEWIKQDRFALSLILLITAIVFANTLGNSFIENLDDNVYILDNDIIKHFDWNSLKGMFSTFFQGNYHPITLFSYAVEYKFFGLNPFVFHLTNYIFHLLNTLLVYIFIKRFTGKFWVAAITSLFFGIHPMHVESVAWISERKDMLYAFFFLLSLICYTKYIVTEKRKSYIVWAFIWFLMSLLSKPAAVCLPLVLVLMDFYYYKKISWQTFVVQIPFFALALLFGIVTIFSQRSTHYITDLSPLFNSIFDRILLVSYSSGFYLFKAFAPFSLSAMHYYPKKVDGMLPVEYYLSLPALLLLIWGVLKSGRFKYELIFGLLFYFFTIVLELQLLPVGKVIVSERYSYIPYIGIFFIAGQFFTYIIDNQSKSIPTIKSFIPFVLIILAVFYSFLSYQRNKVWENGEVLFKDIINKYPQNADGWYVLGNSEDTKNNFDAAITDYTKAIELASDPARVYIGRGYSENAENNLDAAITDYTKAIELASDPARVYIGRGYSENAENNLDAALADYTKAIELNPNLADAYLDRGIVEGRENNLDAAITDFTRTIELAPNFFSAYLNRGIVEDTKQNFDAAITDYTKAMELNPTLPDIYYDRGNSEREKKDFDAAIRDYTKTMELAPNFFSAYLNRGIVENTKQNFDAAITDYTKVIKLNPNNFSAYYNRGNSESEKKDFDAAIRDYTKSIELNSHFTDAYFNRALIYYKTGRYEAAVTDFTQTLTLHPNDNTAYYYHGMAELGLHNMERACKDWLLAEQYGNPLAAAALKQYCK